MGMAALEDIFIGNERHPKPLEKKLWYKFSKDGVDSST